MNHLHQAPAKVMIIGGGGREHAIAWKLSSSPRVKEIICLPGNGGTANLAKSRNINVNLSDFNNIAKLALDNKVDLVVIGPDDPLAQGIVDYLEKSGLRVFGPKKEFALIESSKIFAKAFMEKYQIPTPRYVIASSYNEALELFSKNPWAQVIKADGLALGKGVFVCDNETQVEEAISAIFREKKFGNSGNRVIMEERLYGEELSLLMFCDGKTIVPMPPAQDHKRRYDNDKGPNTGGMGAYAPASIYARAYPVIHDTIIRPIQKALDSRDFGFKGVLYAGLLIVESKHEFSPYVLEFNARFGDPETQAILPLLKSDLLEIFWSCTEGKLSTLNIDWSTESSCCVVACHKDYPESSSQGKEISELPPSKEDTLIFQAGTKLVNGKLVTNGGRILAVTGLGQDMESAINKAYAGISQVTFPDMDYRHDIARRTTIAWR